MDSKFCRFGCLWKLYIKTELEFRKNEIRLHLKRFNQKTIESIYEISTQLICNSSGHFMDVGKSGLVFLMNFVVLLYEFL